MVLCKANKYFYFEGEISYSDGLNDQSKLFNNFFFVKILWDIKFYDFLSFLAIF
jgi:hypothetical protein